VVESDETIITWLTYLAMHPDFRLKRLFLMFETFLTEIDFKKDYWRALDLALSESLTTSGLELIELSLTPSGSKLKAGHKESLRQEIRAAFPLVGSKDGGILSIDLSRM
jgi:hypothetical protein